MLEIPFTSLEACAVNRGIFETIYYAALESRAVLAEARGLYSAWEGSAAFQGVLQVDLWDGDTTD